MPRIISLLSLEVCLINLECFPFRRYCRKRSVADKRNYKYSLNLEPDLLERKYLEQGKSCHFVKAALSEPFLQNSSNVEWFGALIFK